MTSRKIKSKIRSRKIKSKIRSRKIKYKIRSRKSRKRKSRKRKIRSRKRKSKIRSRKRKKKKKCEEDKYMKWVNGKCVKKTREEIKKSLLKSMKNLKDDDVRRVLFKKCLKNVKKYKEYFEMGTYDFHDLFLDENLTDEKLDMLIDIQKCRGKGETSEGINQDTEWGPLLMYIFAEDNVDIPPTDNLLKIIDKLKDTEYDINFHVVGGWDNFEDQTLLTMVLLHDDINEEDKLKIVEKILSSFPNLTNVLNIQDRNEKRTDYWGKTIKNIKPTYFLNMQDEDGDTLLFSKYMEGGAYSNSTPALFKKLLDMDFNKINLNIKNNEGHTLIEDILTSGYLSFEEVEPYLLELVKKINNTAYYKFDINKKYNFIDDEKYTLLMLAALFDWGDLAKELLKNPNIDVEEQNKEGKSAYFFTYGDYIDEYEHVDGSSTVRGLLKNFMKGKGIGREWWIGFWENNDTSRGLEDAMHYDSSYFDKKCKYEDWDYNKSCKGLW